MSLLNGRIMTHDTTNMTTIVNIIELAFLADILKTHSHYIKLYRLYFLCRGFQFPIDMHLEPEYWAETGELDEVERHEINILENELFTVQPKTGQLEPGAKTTVIASYKSVSYVCGINLRMGYLKVTIFSGYKI